MIKINLLPGHVAERRKVRSLAKLVVFALLLEVIGLSYFVVRLVDKEKQLGEKYKDVHQSAEAVRAMEKTTQAEQAAAAPYKGAVGWYDSIIQQNAKIADTLVKVNEYIYARLTVRNLSVNGATVQLAGSTRDIDQVAKAYFNLLRSKYIQTGSVKLSGISGGGAGGRAVTSAGGGGGGGGGPGFRSGMGRFGGGRTTPTTRGRAPANPNEAMGVSFTFLLWPDYGMAGGGRPGGGTPAGGGGGPGGFRGRMMGGGGR